MSHDFSGFAVEGKNWNRGEGCGGWIVAEHALVTEFRTPLPTLAQGLFLVPRLLSGETFLKGQAFAASKSLW